jgi:hypothetical protein
VGSKETSEKEVVDLRGSQFDIRANITSLLYFERRKRVKFILIMKSTAEKKLSERR